MADNHLNIEAGFTCYNCGAKGSHHEGCPAVRRAPVADGAALRWKFNGIAGLKPYLTDKQYQAQTPGTKKWYDPICDRCGPDDGAAVDLPELPQPAFHTQHGYVYLAEQVEQIQREAISHYLRKQAGQVGEQREAVKFAAVLRNTIVAAKKERNWFLADLARDTLHQLAALEAGQEGEQPTINKGENA